MAVDGDELLQAIGRLIQGVGALSEGLKDPLHCHPILIALHLKAVSLFSAIHFNKYNISPLLVL